MNEENAREYGKRYDARLKRCITNGMLMGAFTAICLLGYAALIAMVLFKF